MHGFCVFIENLAGEIFLCNWRVYITVNQYQMTELLNLKILIKIYHIVVKKADKLSDGMLQLSRECL